jgi:hypothetical protein
MMGVGSRKENMRTGFVLPSCTYNIVLSKDDLTQLLEKGYIAWDPIRINGTFRDEFGVSHDASGHSLFYSDKHGEQPVQFVGLALDNGVRKKET